MSCSDDLGGTTVLSKSRFVFKWLISLSLLIVLGWRLRSEPGVEKYWCCNKDWTLLALGYAVCIVSVLMTIVRWHLLLRAAGVPITPRETLRLGLFSYFVNLISVGNLGGDVGRMILVNRVCPGRGPEVIASVVIDRVIGLYALLLVAAIAVVSSDTLRSSDASMQMIAFATLFFALLGTVVVLALAALGSVWRRTHSVSVTKRFQPFCGIMAKVIRAFQCYRRQPVTLVVTLAISVALRVLTTIGVYLIAKGIMVNAPAVSDQFIVVPLAMVAASIPLPLNGLGAFEVIMEYLYRQLPNAAGGAGQGALIAIGYRGVMIIVGAVGAMSWNLLGSKCANKTHPSQGDSSPGPAVPKPFRREPEIHTLPHTLASMHE
jgi:glycosyltransferase 2 family protein